MSSASAGRNDHRSAGLLADGDSPARVEVGNFLLNRLARVVRVDGAEVALTRLEFDLLSFLTEHAGQVLDHESLYGRVWGRGLTDDRRTLYVHVRRLRTKLRRAPLAITTVSGVGYRFDF